MSWGVDIVVEHGDGYRTVIDVVDGHTYNLNRMWRWSGACRYPRDFDGRRCDELAPVLAAALADALAHPDDYRAMNPPNGWGDYEGFVEILGRFAELTSLHPRGVVRWSG